MTVWDVMLADFRTVSLCAEVHIFSLELAPAYAGAEFTLAIRRIA